MEATTIDAIKTLGFPIVVACFLAYVIWRFTMWMMATGDRLSAKFETHVDTVGNEIRSIKPQLDRIESKVDKQVCVAADVGRGTKSVTIS